MDEIKENLILLNMVDGLGSVRLRALLERFDSPAGILKASPSGLQSVPGIGKTVSDGIREAAKGQGLKKELSLMKKHGVKIVTIFDNDYPSNLKEIYDPPILLYLKGEIAQRDTASVGVVGSRHASYYGLSTAEKLSREFASFGWTVVSGLARGIDTYAHKGAVKANGRTIAVLGNGLSEVYPPENKKLADEIAEKGCLCSEFPMETKPDRRNFPMRNRIISGLSLGTVVVEAAERSGALITADSALEQGREVFAVPGNVNSPNSQGTNSLIKQGAKLIDDAIEVLEELTPALKNRNFIERDCFTSFAMTTKGEVIARSGATRQSNLENLAQTTFPLPSPNVSRAESNVYNALGAEPLHIDELVETCGIPVSQMLGLLMKLEIKGLIRQLPGKAFVKK